MNTRYGVWLRRGRRSRYGWAWENEERGVMVTRFQHGAIPKAAYVFMNREDAEAYALKVALKDPETMGRLEVRLFAVPERLSILFKEERCGASATVPDSH
jgi:hypothetical protein